MSYNDPMDYGIRIMASMMSTLVFVVTILVLLSYYQNPKPFIDYDGPNVIYWYWLGVFGTGIGSSFLNFLMIRYIIKSFKKGENVE